MSIIQEYGIIWAGSYKKYCKSEDVDKLINLFSKYINHVSSCEGYDYIEAQDYDKDTNLTDNEQKILKEIKNLFKERGE
jgi:hypothetical protein